jgi:hypothetical protein
LQHAKLLTIFTLAAALPLAGCGKQPAAPTAAAPTAAAPAATANEMPAGHPHPMVPAPQADVDLSGIEKAEGGVTVAELYASKAELAGETVKVRGKVVKLNPGIMGTNWVHVRDGSGDEGANNLTVTTSALPALGDTVVVSGLLQVDRDFGMGYRYDLIIEEAEVEIEAQRKAAY